MHVECEGFLLSIYLSNYVVRMLSVLCVHERELRTEHLLIEWWSPQVYKQIPSIAEKQ